MVHHVDPNVLRQLRDKASLTQEALAKRARLNEQTIHRLESVRGPARQRQSTVEKLCKALDTDVETLAGRKPLGADPSSARPDLVRTQLNVRIERPVRNAFSLVAMRYGVSVTRIVEYAPLLFMLLAEQSLARRRQKLAEVKVLAEQAQELHAASFPYLPWMNISSIHDEAIDAEQQSIDKRDVFGETIVLNFEGPQDDFADPFTELLKELASRLGKSIEIKGFYGWPRPYGICRDDVIALIGEDEDLVDAVLDGWVQLHEMPKDLHANGPVAARAEWVREKQEAHLAERLRDSPPLILDFPAAAPPIGEQP